MVEECIEEVTCQLFLEQLLPRAQAISSPLGIPLGWVHSCLWMESDDGRLVADKVFLNKMDCLVVGLLEWIFLCAWGA